MEKKLYELTIDPELEKIAPPLSATAYEILKKGIIEDGCIFPLIVWNSVIVDGHNRYQICHENHIPFAYEEMAFESKSAAKMWIVSNQIGRRNLTDFQCCEMVYELKDEVKEEAARRKKAGKHMQNSAYGTTRGILADMAGVSHATWDEAAVIIEKGDDEDKDKLRTGKAKIHQIFTKIKKAETPSKEVPQNKAKEEPSKSTQPDSPISPDPLPVEREDYRTDHMDAPFEVPAMRDDPMKEPRPFQFVKDQIWFAVENYLKEIQIGLNWLRDEDTDKKSELLATIEDGHKRAIELLKKEEQE